MVPQRLDQLERFAAISRLEERRRLGAGVDHIRLVIGRRLDLPDPFDAGAGIGSEVHGGTLGLGPGPAKIIGIVDARAPVFAGSGCEHPRPVPAAVDADPVDRLHQELRRIEGPLCSFLIRTPDPQTFTGAHQYQGFSHDPSLALLKRREHCGFRQGPGAADLRVRARRRARRR
jgi:hypothetical protein